LQVQVHVDVAFVTDEAVHLVHKLSIVGCVTIGVVHHQFQHTQLVLHFIVKSELIHIMKSQVGHVEFSKLLINHPLFSQLGAEVGKV
jgi:hypothetical protein